MGLRQVTGLVCARCRERLPPRATTCPSCADAGLVEVAYDYADAGRGLDRDTLMRREPWMWRYKELLPLDELAELPCLQVGMTPVYGAARLGEWVGLPNLLVKDEARSPSGSLEDRASALALVEARESGRRVLAVASGGAAAGSLACFAAACGVRSVVFAPDDADPAELALASCYGALVLRVSGGLFAARALCAQACHTLRWFDRTAAATPYPFEGKKTLGHEIGELLCERPPDWVVVAADDAGETLGAVARGLDELRKVRLLTGRPRLLGVGGADQLPALSGRSEEPSWRRAAEALRESEGGVAMAAPEACAEAATEAARRAGLCVDGAGAAALAGLRSAVAEGTVEKSSTVLVVVGGRGRQTALASAVDVGQELQRVEEAAAQAGLTN